MLKQEQIIINGKVFLKSYSDSGKYIRQLETYSYYIVGYEEE